MLLSRGVKQNLSEENMQEEKKLVKKKWVGIAIKILKTELVKHDLNYPELQKKLEAIGVIESVEVIRNKMMLGTFSAIFFLQCLHAMGVDDIHLDASFFEDKKDKK